MAYEITCEESRRGALYARGYGAKGDGVADDTAAIRAAITAAAGGGTVILAPGVYLVSPGAENADVLSVPSGSQGLRIVGRGATIKVKNGSLPYRSVLSAGTATRLHMEGLTFDHNVAGNPIRSVGELLGGGPRFSVSANGSGITVQDCEVTNASSVNDLVLSGSAIVVRGCRWTAYGDDPTHTTHDSSCIYTQNASGVLIEGCHFEGASLGAPAAHTAIETHGSDHVIRGNVIRNFFKGINLTGIATTTSTGLVVVHNVVRGAAYGVMIHSGPYLTHTEGFGIDGAVVECNVIHLAQTDAWAVSAHALGGIVVYPAATLDVRGLKIRGNVVVSPIEAELLAANTASCALGWYSNEGQTMHASDISGNTVVGFPMAGIRLSCGVRGVRVTDNQLHDVGSTLDSSIPIAYRTPIFVYSPTGVGLTIDRNTIQDSHAVTRNHHGLYLSTAGAAAVYVRDNSIEVEGDAAAFESAAFLAEGAAPFVRGLYRNQVDEAAA